MALNTTSLCFRCVVILIALGMLTRGEVSDASSYSVPDLMAQKAEICYVTDE